MRHVIASILIYIGMIQPMDIAEYCSVYEVVNLDGIEIFICYDFDYQEVLGDRDSNLWDDAEPVPLGSN